MSTGDPNSREDVPFPNPQAPVPPGPAFQPPPEPSPVLRSLNGAPQHQISQPPPVESPPPAAEFSPQAFAMLSRLGSGLGVSPLRSSVTYAELSSLVKQAKSMPYGRLMNGAEMVVELAQMMAVDCTKAGHPIDFATALRSIHKISGVLSEDPVVFAQIATLFQ